jgi:hypothetical protein
MYPSFPWARFGQLLAAIALLWLLINTWQLWFVVLSALILDGYFAQFGQ